MPCARSKRAKRLKPRHTDAASKMQRQTPRHTVKPAALPNHDDGDVTGRSSKGPIPSATRTRRSRHQACDRRTDLTSAGVDELTGHTHVIRGDDHVNNTAAQINIFKRSRAAPAWPHPRSRADEKGFETPRRSQRNAVSGRSTSERYELSGTPAGPW